jgi:hypothetical protein
MKIPALLRRLPVLLLLLGAPGQAQEPSGIEPPRHAVNSGDFGFTLIPKAFQKNPTLDMTFNTELTALGRALPPASPEHPVYYVVDPLGYRPMGGLAANEHPPQQGDMEKGLTKALATNGFLPASAPDHPATLLLIYFWGSHYKLPPAVAKDFPELYRQNILERAMLVGGRDLAAKVAYRMDYGNIRAPGENENSDSLIYQARAELYYVVASAYDYAAVGRGERHLLWRTTMTVNSGGVGLAETMRPLVASAAPFFGRATSEPEIGSRQIEREGHVEIGPVTVKEYGAPGPEAGEKKPSGK